MLAPAVMFIESAIDWMKKLDYMPDWLKESQQKELNSLGPARAQLAGASGMTEDFSAGYALGLATARMILAGSPLLAMKKINPKDLL
jgi:hypothetical protein